MNFREVESYHVLLSPTQLSKQEKRRTEEQERKEEEEGEEEERERYIPIIRIDSEDESRSIHEVMSPKRSYLILSSYVPHGHLELLVLDGLYVEAYGRDGRHHISQLQTIGDCCLSWYHVLVSVVILCMFISIY